MFLSLDARPGHCAAGPVPGIDRVVPVSELAAALSGTEVLVVAAPRTRASTALIGAAELSLLKPHSYLVDVSRGGVTDVQAVVDALAGGRLQAAALDVFETEPLPPDSPLWEIDKLLITPHTAGWTRGYGDKLAEVVAGNIDALVTGQPLLTPVDRDAGY